MSHKRTRSQTEPQLLAPPTARRKLDMPLETTPNDRDDDAHAGMNAAVLATTDYNPSVLGIASSYNSIDIGETD